MYVRIYLVGRGVKLLQQERLSWLGCCCLAVLAARSSCCLGWMEDLVLLCSCYNFKFFKANCWPQATTMCVQVKQQENKNITRSSMRIRSGISQLGCKRTDNCPPHICVSLTLSLYGKQTEMCWNSYIRMLRIFVFQWM